MREDVGTVTRIVDRIVSNSDSSRSGLAQRARRNVCLRPNVSPMFGRAARLPAVGQLSDDQVNLAFGPLP